MKNIIRIVKPPVVVLSRKEYNELLRRASAFDRVSTDSASNIAEWIRQLMSRVSEAISKDNSISSTHFADFLTRKTDDAIRAYFDDAILNAKK